MLDQKFKLCNILEVLSVHSVRVVLTLHRLSYSVSMNTSACSLLLDLLNMSYPHYHLLEHRRHRRLHKELEKHRIYTAFARFLKHAYIFPFRIMFYNLKSCFIFVIKHEVWSGRFDRC